MGRGWLLHTHSSGEGLLGYNLWGCGRQSATTMTQCSHVDSCRASPTLGLGRAGDWGWNVGGREAIAFRV